MKDDDVISLPIDEVVRKTYETVQRTRTRIRRQLVRNEIKKSREGILDGAILQSTNGQRKEETKQQTHDDDIGANNSIKDVGDETTTTTDDKGARLEEATPSNIASGPRRSDRPRNGPRKRLIETLYIKDYSRTDSDVQMKDDGVISLPIDEVVQKTYKTVQHTRNRIRRKLLHNEIKESLEGVFGGATACDVDVNDSGTLNSTTSQKRRRSDRHHASSVARDVNDCREITSTFITTAMDDRWIGQCCNAVMKKSNSLSNGQNTRRAAIHTWRRTSFDERRRSALVFPRLPTNDESISNN
jgi:hypothetical protein